MADNTHSTLALPILATPLTENDHCIRFQSEINERIFSIAHDEQGFDFVELLVDVPDPDRNEMRDIYQGSDRETLMSLVMSELTKP